MRTINDAIAQAYLGHPGANALVHEAFEAVKRVEARCVRAEEALRRIITDCFTYTEALTIAQAALGAVPEKDAG